MASIIIIVSFEIMKKAILKILLFFRSYTHLINEIPRSHYRKKIRLNIFFFKERLFQVVLCEFWKLQVLE